MLALASVVAVAVEFVAEHESKHHQQREHQRSKQRHEQRGLKNAEIGGGCGASMFVICQPAIWINLHLVGCGVMRLHIKSRIKANLESSVKASLSCRHDR